MCGIVAAVSLQKNIVHVLVEGLKRLEYRGYDSCGLAIIHDHTLTRARSTSRIVELANQTQTWSSTVGIAHTRWATHGKPDTLNAHPHFSGDLIGIVHNGIIENYETLKAELITLGYQFSSETDTEVVAHLIHYLYTETNSVTQGRLLATVQAATSRLKGAYALAVICKDSPEYIVGAREGSPLVFALGENANYLASDAMALAGSSSEIAYLEDGDVVELAANNYQIYDRHQTKVVRPIKNVQAALASVELGPYAHYMQKEIFEQPKAIADTLEGIESISSDLFGPHANHLFKNSQRILILACGTSYYSGMTAKYWLESVANIPTQVEIASEYRYRKPAVEPSTLVVVISQSGETADTMAALKYAKSLGIEHSLAICNVATSAMVRETDAAFITHAGPEIGVASTKAFTTQLTALFILTLAIAKTKNLLSTADEKQYIESLRHLPNAVNQVLALEPAIIGWAQKFASKENALFLGRGMHYPIALEGALKLKEITYIHAESYPAGELKHGPLALVTEHMPVVTVAPNDALLEKLDSNIQEVKARGGQLFVFADKGIHIEPSPQINIIHLPENYGLLSPILHVVPLQLLAYHTACLRGTDVDKPRNLAKSVTVE